MTAPATTRTATAPVPPVTDPLDLHDSATREAVTARMRSLERMSNSERNAAVARGEASELEITVAGLPKTRDRARTDYFWAMGKAARQLAMFTMSMDYPECFPWAQRAPHEVPRLHGELWFIAIFDAALRD